MKLNVIGDIHGRNNWKQLVDINSINVFVGDYFDPYEQIKYEDLESNFLDIIQFKNEHPETVLLIGNHDDHYIHQGNGKSSRFNFVKSNQIRTILDSNIDKLQIAYYNQEHNVIITHAGITKTWYKTWFGELDTNPQIICDNINYMYNENPDAFSFSTNNRDYWECYGDEIYHSPIWVRPNSLLNDSLDNINQIVGHTRFQHVVNINNITFVDCLGANTDSFKE